MLRNIHFFNIKEGADEARMRHMLDVELAENAATFGCIERKTWRLLDAHAGGKAIAAAQYMNESLWPSQAEADAFSRAASGPEVKAWLDELMGGIEIVQTVRYVDEAG